jgi:hypothetical protein
MVRRLLLPGAILFLILLTVPACNSDRNTDKKDSLPPDQAPPSPKPAGKPG